MNLLSGIRSPADVRALPLEQLPKLAEEVRQRIIDVVGKSGGHFASNLGVVELTIALHRVFDFGQDRLLWDVGHQCYPHKLLTGRNEHFDMIRKAGGPAGFPEISESEFDLFNVGHAGTAIATAVGMARADALLQRDTHVVALVGDASIVNGVAFEGLNQAGTLRRQFLVVLNDNEWGISPTQGGLAERLTKLRASNVYDEIKQQAKRLLPRVPLLGRTMAETLGHLKNVVKATVAPHQIFENLGFQYVGPIDGHDLPHLIEMLQIVKNVHHPVLLHVHTVKGKGCDWACADPGKFHSPKPFKVENGKATIISGPGKSWTKAFVEILIDLAKEDSRIFAMTAGMPDGTGLNKMMDVMPERCMDIGIAESCTVDMAAGMAKAGLRPVCAIYSTFLQRAFDQVFQEVVLQGGHPVLFCLDRAGVVGGDGPVHHGFLDIAYLRSFPRFVLMAPADELELRAAMKFALTLDQPAAIRYPRDNVPEPLAGCPPFEMGISQVLREGEAATILAYGTTVHPALEAANLLAADGHQVAVINARFARPIDREMVVRAFAAGRPVVTVEDHSVSGGFGSAVLEVAQELGLDSSGSVRLGLPADRLIPHGSRSAQLAEAGIDAAGIAAAVRRLLEARTPAGMARGAARRALAVH